MPAAPGELYGHEGFPYCSCNTGEKNICCNSGLGPVLGMGDATCDETNTQLWDISLKCLLFYISREMGGNTSFTLSKVSEYEGSGRSVVWSSAPGVGFFLLLCPTERLNENLSACVAALLKGQLGFTGRVLWTMWTDAVECGGRANF